MGWLTAKQQDFATNSDDGGRHIILDPFGVRRANNADEVSQDGSYDNYVKNAYSRNELAYACIAYRAESLPQSVLRVFPDSRRDILPINEHPLRRLFEQPNPEISEFEFWELSSTYKDIAGTAFIYIVRSISDTPAELWPLAPNLISVQPIPERRTYQWIYRPDPMRPEIRIAIHKDDMIRVRYPNPDTSDPGFRYFGQPPLRPAARAVSVDNAATNFVSQILKNHAVPMTVIETEEKIDKPLHERLRALWQEAFGGARRGTPAFLQKGMKVHELGLSLTDLEFPDLRSVSETRICGAFRVEPVLVGAKVGLEHNAYKDYHQARLSFWEEAMVSEQRRWVEPMRKKLLPSYTGIGRRRIRLDWDNTGVLALRESQGDVWQRATEALARGGITRNDFRRIVGLPIVPNGDVFLTPSGVEPQDSGEEIEVLASSYGLLAAEYGVELTRDEISALVAKGHMEAIGNE